MTLALSPQFWLCVQLLSTEFWGISGASPSKGVRQVSQKRAGATKLGFPSANAGPRRLCAPSGSAVTVLASIDLTGDQGVA